MTADARLSDRERQVLALRLEYYSCSEIAERLGISLKTVRTHLTNARHKFQVRTTSELCRVARQRGIA